MVIGPTDPDKSDAIDPAVFDQAAADGVVLTGTRHDMPECYAAADVFVTASWREGFPRSAMEAAAMGLPTVATDIRGNRQVIADGETGLLVPVRDPAGIRSAVAQLVADAEREDGDGSCCPPACRRRVRPAAHHRPHPRRLRAPPLTDYIAGLTRVVIVGWLRRSGWRGVRAW